MSIGTRRGPYISYSCIGCKYHDLESAGHGDYLHWCEHSSVIGDDERKYIPHSGATPDWCPYMKEEF